VCRWGIVLSGGAGGPIAGSRAFRTGRAFSRLVAGVSGVQTRVWVIGPSWVIATRRWIRPSRADSTLQERKSLPQVVAFQASAINFVTERYSLLLEFQDFLSKTTVLVFEGV
jgi:hypothetical protein